MESTLLPLVRPSTLSNKVPDDIEHVSINYKGRQICASKMSDVDAYIEDDAEDEQL